MTTRLTKTGQPVMGTPIEVCLTDGSWERAMVVGKLFGRRANHLIGVIVEWSDGARQDLMTVSADFAHDIGDTWRTVQARTEAST